MAIVTSRSINSSRPQCCIVAPSSAMALNKSHLASKLLQSRYMITHHCGMLQVLLGVGEVQDCHCSMLQVLLGVGEVQDWTPKHQGTPPIELCFSLVVTPISLLPIFWLTSHDRVNLRLDFVHNFAVVLRTWYHCWCFVLCKMCQRIDKIRHGQGGGVNWRRKA